MYRILNFIWFHLALSKSIILPDYWTSDPAFEKGLIKVWPTLAMFNKLWFNVYLQRSFNVLLLTLDKFPKMTFQKRSHNVKANAEATFLKRFYAGWENIIFCFPRVFLILTKIFILGGGLGTRLPFYEVLSFSCNILIS